MKETGAVGSHYVVDVADFPIRFAICFRVFEQFKTRPIFVFIIDDCINTTGWTLDSLMKSLYSFVGGQIDTHYSFRRSHLHP
jgi:hypothetical protein